MQKAGAAELGAVLMKQGEVTSELQVRHEVLASQEERKAMFTDRQPFAIHQLRNAAEVHT